MNPATRATWAALLPVLVPARALAAAELPVTAGSPLPWLFIGTALLIVCGLLLRHRTPKIRTRLATLFGRRRLHAALAQARVAFLERCVLPGEHDGLTRIDCALATSAGIVCLRVVHLGGTVFGHAREPQWSCVDGVTRQGLLNPLIQNEGRVRAVRRVVGDEPVANLVVFTGDADLSGTRAGNVVRVEDLPAWLNDYQDAHRGCSDPDAAWLTLAAAVRTDAASQRDFEAQLSFG